MYALALATGKLKWEYQLNAPMKTGPGPDGVAVAGGTVYGVSPTTVFALNARTGKKIWADSHLLSTGQGTFEIQPQVADGRVYLASAYGSGPGGGVLLALTAASGALLWKFNTLLGADAGVQSVGLGSGRRLGDAAGQQRRIGDVRHRQSLSKSAASAIAHPSAQLYTDSDVNLDAATGKLRWYYQGVPNDFKDYDMQASPISASVNGVPVVIGAGKMGYVYEMNAQTGKLIWKTPVGEHNGHDNDSLLALEHKITLKAALHDSSRIAGRRTDQHGPRRQQHLCGHHRPAAHLHKFEPGPSRVRPPACSPERWRLSISRRARSNGTRRCRICRSVPPQSRMILSSPRSTTVS